MSKGPKVLAVILLLSLFTTDAFAWRPFSRVFNGRVRRVLPGNGGSLTDNGGIAGHWGVGLRDDDQTRAINKARIMAQRGVLSHGVAPIVAGFEGIGCASNAACGTCIPRGSMTLTADASAYSTRTGLWYRVRGWR